MGNYKIGDKFVRKNTCDTFAMEIISIIDGPYETFYELQPIISRNNVFQISESVLTKEYHLIKRYG